MATNILENLLRVGVVSSTNPANCTARVAFPDKDDLVSGDLFVGVRGSLHNKDYWLPDVGESVLCVFLPNDKDGVNIGFILCSYYNEQDKPSVNSQDKRHISFADGSFIEHDRSTGGLNISCTGPVTINGRTINLN